MECRSFPTHSDGGPLTVTSSKPEDTADAADSASTAPLSRKRKRKAVDEVGGRGSEYGVSRGIDFVDVACVINFDLPPTSRSYIHRVGRTARAGRSGMALSFVVPGDQWGKAKIKAVDVSLPTAKEDDKVWNRIVKSQESKGAELNEYKFDMKQVEPFRYRMQDGLKAVTKASVREARVKEIKNEVVNSERLKAHFEDHPHDLAFLRHDKPLHPARIQHHMKHVPAYLMPRIATTAIGAGSDQAETVDGPKQPEGGGGTTNRAPGNVSFHKQGRGAGRGGRGGGGQRGRSSTRGRGGKPKNDPLRTFRSHK